jgi:hypothetical protein
MEPAFPVWPNDKRSGDPAVDRVLDAVFSEDPGALDAVTEFFPLPCIASYAVTGRPPFCGPGEAVGTPVDWFFVGGTEGEYLRRDAPLRLEAFGGLLTLAPRLVAIYEHHVKSLGSRIVIVLAPTMTLDGAGSDTDDCVRAPRLTVNLTGLTGILFACESRSTLLPPDGRYLVSPRSSP